MAANIRAQATGGAGARRAAPAGATRVRGAGASSRSRRERLLSAAAGLFAERGYSAVTLADIGGAAGISGPGVYRHFASKEGLLGELLVDVSERLLSSAEERVAATAGPEATLVALVEFHAGFAVDNPALITIQSRELPALSAEDQLRVRRLQRTYVELWADTVIRAGRFEGREEAIAAAHAIFGLLNSTPHSRRLAGDETRTLLRSLALAALLPAGPSPGAGP
ncbi:MAG: TetR/AcrR family transcriptional regulator [Candidatus Dormibacteria bacterium]|jgi:AcrR family transcriptional regulator